ncbi:patatin-like phospholipase family protein [Nocardioides sp. 1609]|uniref:patatin-like phospholipase family protein n=1 Tax=Nocardioides sp. 1609 TaxID=2508327 RepID=UPI00106F451A|nr:patatin-like phospholipase family protein [Nocardioides sp. 1609]
MTTRGLVLGGGGITGIAWETGLLWGLAEAGVDLTDADRVIGTSAGSIVGAQVTSSIPLEELYRRQLLPPAELGDGGVPLASIGLGVVARFAGAMLRSRGDLERFGRVLGRAAVTASAQGRTPSVAERYDQVAQRIGGIEWPDRDLVVTAVDVATGELAAFGPRGSTPEVRLEDAVNASCAVPCVYPPIRIGTRTFVDGGVRSGSNADLAAGCDAVVALTPVDRSVGPMHSAARILGRMDVRHLVITPDAGSVAAIGKNVLDPEARPPSARAGYAQAKAHVAAVRELWD